MAHILELSTTEPKQNIKIDGKLYPVKSGDSISLEVSIGVSRMQRQFSKLSSPDDVLDIPDEEISALGESCRKLCDDLLEAPQELKDSLTDTQRVNIIRVVFTEPAREVAKPAKKKKTSSSSRRSKGSTADLRKTG